MDALMQAFYGVMYKYQKHFSEKGVRANLDAWEQRKKGLLELLRRHPNWSEDDLAVVLDLSESREINRDVVDESKFILNELVGNVLTDPDRREQFDAALQLATEDYCQFPPQEKIQRLNQLGVRCAPGQKASRIIGRLCHNFGIDRHAQYNSAYARLSDALNPLTTARTGVLSIHPCDFLEMSNRDNSWSSCHGLAHGSYQAGCLSYLTDGVSMIFFTVDGTVTSGFHLHPKRTRQIFCYGENVLLQSRLYPDSDDDLCLQYRRLVQEIITTCLGMPNRWVLKKASDRQNEEYFQTVQGSRQYPDYLYFSKVSLLKKAESYGTLQIGSPSLCVCCGEPYTSGWLKCNCDELVVCSECGRTVPAETSQYHEGRFFCNSCLHVCAACGNVIHGDLYPAFNRRGYLIEVCADCYQQMTTACGHCSVQPICGLLSGSRLCARAAITPAVA